MVSRRDEGAGEIGEDSLPVVSDHARDPVQQFRRVPHPRAEGGRDDLMAEADPEQGDAGIEGRVNDSDGVSGVVGMSRSR